jgi:hypothetical protein
MEKGAAAAAPAVAAALGALVSLLGGPMTVAAKSAASGLVGAVRELDDAGLDAGFLDQVSRGLRAGGAATIAQVEEDRQLPLDARILARGGRVLRHRLAGALAEERTAREVAALRCELRSLLVGPTDAEHADTEETVRRARIAELQQAQRRAQALAEALRREAAAKVQVLRAQAAQLDGAARNAVANRAATVRSALEARAARLDRIAESPTPARSATGRNARPPPETAGES